MLPIARRRFLPYALLALTGSCISLTALAQPAGYRGLEELGDPANEARRILVFEARAGVSLRTTLAQWSKLAGWGAPDWQMAPNVDFAIGSTIRFEGDYKTATRSFLRAMGTQANLEVSFDEPQRRAVIRLKKDLPTPQALAK